MGYQCFVDGCPGAHESKRQICSRPSNHGLTVERLRLLIQHYSDELPDSHSLYSEWYKIAERQTVAALTELITLRGEALAMVSGDLAAMIRAYQSLKECQ